MLDALRRGDHVVTQGGIYGKITKVKGDDAKDVEIEIAEGVRINVVRGMIGSVISKTEPASISKANSMLHFPLWKSLGVVCAVLFAFLFALPNVFYSSAERANLARVEIANGATSTPELEADLSAWPSFLPSDLVSLGLDLRGGAHVLVEVEIEQVFAERMEVLRSDARSALREGGVRRYTDLSAHQDSVSVNVTNIEDVENAITVFNELAQPIGAGLTGYGSPDITVEASGSTVTATLTDAAKTDSYQSGDVAVP